MYKQNAHKLNTTMMKMTLNGTKNTVTPNRTQDAEHANNILSSSGEKTIRPKIFRLDLLKLSIINENASIMTCNCIKLQNSERGKKQKQKITCRVWPNVLATAIYRLWRPLLDGPLVPVGWTVVLYTHQQCTRHAYSGIAITDRTM